MPDAQKPPAKKSAAKRPRAKKAADAPAPEPKPRAARRKPDAPPADAADAAADAPGAQPPAAAAGGSGGKVSVMFPTALYGERKDDIKRPFKEHGLKWQFLGEGRGRYHKPGVAVFVQFHDEGVQYTLSGEDQATVDALLAAWKGELGVDALREAKGAGAQAQRAATAAQESEEMKLWRIQEPQRRPGEPDFFFRKRTEEWQARRPGA